MPMKNIVRVFFITIGILLVPWVAMQFTEEVNWTVSDFLLMGGMLFITGLLLELILTKMGKYRLLGALLVVGLFLWLWVELAVGLFTNWGS